MIGKSALASLPVAAAAILYTTPSAMAESPRRVEYPDIYDPVDAADAAELAPSSVLSRAQPGTGLGRLYNLSLEKLAVQPVASGENRYWLSFLLASRIKTGREVVDQGLVTADAYTQRFRAREREVAESVSELRSQDEELVPNLFYVLIGGLTGSILSRRRNFALRAVTPVVGAGIAMKFFMPHTWNNLTTQLAQYERRNLPRVAEAQDSVVGALDTATAKTRSAVSSVRKTIREWTGL